MAKVPVYNVPTVSPENISDIRGYANAQTFGAGVGQAVSGLGGQISQAGDMLAANALRMQQQVNQADADTMMTDWVIQQGELDTKLNSLQGKARSEFFPEYVAATKALREGFANKSSNPEVKRLFHNETRRLAAYSIRNGASAVATGLRQYETKANKGLEDLAIVTVQANPDSDAAYQEGLSTLQRARRQQSALDGDDEGTVNQKLANDESKLLAARIASMARKDPAKAVEIYEKNKSKIRPADQVSIENVIYTGQQKAGTEGALLSQGMDRAVANDLLQAEEKGILSPLTYEEVRVLKGKVFADDWEMRRADNLKIWKHTAGLPTMTETRMDFELSQIAPKEGKNFAREYQIFKRVKAAVDAQKDLRKIDPAASVEKDPLVQDAIRNADAVLGGREDPEWIKLVGDARLAAQELAGIAPTMRSPATNAEIAPLMQPMRAPTPGSEIEVITKVAQSFKDKYGPAWEQTFTRALFADRYSAETRATAMDVVRSLISGKPVSTTTAGQVRTGAEIKAAKDVIGGDSFIAPPISGVRDPIINNPSYTDESPTYVDEFGITQRVPRETKRGKPLSQKYREEYGAR